MSGELLSHVLANPPRCLAGVTVSPASEQGGHEPTVVSLNLSSEKGETTAKLRGYINPKITSDTEFVSPISLEWLPSGTANEIFDSNIHGYHGELGSPVHVRGSGEPDYLKCPVCGENVFRVEVKFDFYGGAYDLWEDEPELPIENYFNGIRIFGRCVKGSGVVRLVGMEL